MQLPITRRAADAGSGGGQARFASVLFSPVLESTLWLFWAACACSRLLVNAAWYWNDIRLSRSFALALGHDLYAETHGGILSGLIYGPVSFLLYVPTVLVRSPDWAIVFGIALSILMTLGPVWLVLRWQRPGGAWAGRMSRWLSLLIVFYFLNSGAAGYSIWNIHVDAPALMLACLTCWLSVWCAQRRDFSWAALLGAALCASLLPWTKQTVAPVLVVPMLYFLVIRNRRALLRYTGLTAGLSLLLAIGFSWWLGAGNLLHTMFVAPPGTGFEWRDDAVAMQLEDGAVLLALALVVGAVLASKASRQEWEHVRREITSPSRNPGLVFAAAALILVPTSLLGLFKVGGGINNLAGVDYLLAIGLAVTLLRLSTLPPLLSDRTVQTTLLACLVVLVLFLGARSVPDAARLGVRARAFWISNPSRQAFEFAKRHPAMVYFPAHPLATLLAEGRLYHAEWGVEQSERMGFPISDSQFQRHLPRDLRYIAVYANYDGSGGFTRERLGGSWQIRAVEELPRWTVYTRE